jgi:hypothetical protein
METGISTEIKPAKDRMDRLEKEIQALKSQLDLQKSENKVNIICFSREWDRLFAALSIASGALALGSEVHLFFTFWAVSALRDPDKKGKKGTGPAPKGIRPDHACRICLRTDLKLSFHGNREVLPEKADQEKGHR